MSSHTDISTSIRLGAVQITADPGPVFEVILETSPDIVGDGKLTGPDLIKAWRASAFALSIQLGAEEWVVRGPGLSDDAEPYKWRLNPAASELDEFGREYHAVSDKDATQLRLWDGVSEVETSIVLGAVQIHADPGPAYDVLLETSTSLLGDGKEDGPDLTVKWEKFASALSIKLGEREWVIKGPDPSDTAEPYDWKPSADDTDIDAFGRQYPDAEGKEATELRLWDGAGRVVSDVQARLTVGAVRITATPEDAAVKISDVSATITLGAVSIKTRIAGQGITGTIRWAIEAQAQSVDVLTPSDFRPPWRIQGRRGPTGTIGDRGAPGPPGIPGFPGQGGAGGSRGPTGDPGLKGFPGQRGAGGTRGPQGARGPDGGIGADGNPGADGSPGNPGVRGAPGPKGFPGNAGFPGDPGEDQTGQLEIPGPPGKRGAPGDRGDPGPPKGGRLYGVDVWL